MTGIGVPANSACPVTFALTQTRVKGYSNCLSYGPAPQALKKLASRGQDRKPCSLNSACIRTMQSRCSPTASMLRSPPAQQTRAFSAPACKACLGFIAVKGPASAAAPVKGSGWQEGCTACIGGLSDLADITSSLPDIGAFTGWLLQAASTTLRHPQIHHKHRPIVTPYLLARTVASGFLSPTW